MISVAVCTYNRSRSLESALESLRETYVPDDLAWEILVIDNNSTDDTRRVASAIAEQSALPIRYVFENEQGLSNARNRAVREACGDIIAFLDDDVLVHRDWLRRVAEAFDSHDADCIGGRILLDPALPRPRWWSSEFDGMLGHFDRGPDVIVSRSPADGKIGFGGNLSFRSGVFERFGLFRPDLGRSGDRLLMGEEIELVDRLRCAGRTAVYFPAASVVHRPDVSHLTKAYVRRWYACYGEWEYAQGNGSEAAAARIMGVPRWCLRAAGGQAVSMIAAGARGDASAAFRSELRLRSLGGYMRAARRHARG